MKKIRRLAFFLSLFLCIGLISCVEAGGVRLDVLQKGSFCTEVEGCLGSGEDKTDFAARIEVERRDGVETYRIFYHAPASMEGIFVTVEQQTATGEERVTAGLGELSVAVSRNAVQGWLLPVESLLSVAGQTPESLQKTPQGYQISFAEEVFLIIDEQGLPISFSSPKISLSTHRFQVLEGLFSLFCTKQPQFCYSSFNLHIDKGLIL